LILNSTLAQISDSTVFGTAPTDTVFTVARTGVSSNTNQSGATYVAYLFAHNDGDGEFGPNGNADIVKCGSYQSDGNGSEISVDLGFEAQFVMAKAVSTTGNWHVQDSMRGMAVGSSNNAYLQWNTSDSESADGTAGGIVPTSNGFRVGLMGDINIFNAVQTYIYIAIRRPTAVPTSATEVFAVTTQTGSILPAHDTGFVTDFSLRRENALSSASTIHAVDRLRGKPYLVTDGTNAETNLNANTWDFMDGWYNGGSTGSNKYAWSWKRAPKYFDIVAYSGFLSAGATGTIPHNLTVAPELMIFKNRSSSYGWYVWHSDLTAQRFIQLDTNAAEANFGADWATADKNNINIGFGHFGTSLTGSTYIAYLFASLDGISKVGSVTHSGTTNVDCGFSAGSRFVLLKRTDATGDWYIWDSTRGIVSGNDPYLLLNTTGAEVTNTDLIDPLSSGFTITSSLTAGDYIFYAIA
jgi:hypothetical protein